MGFGDRFKSFFNDVGHSVESGFRSVERAFSPVVDTVKSVGERIGKTGGKLLDLADHTIEGVGKLEDSATKAADGVSDWLKNPILLPALIGIGGLVAISMLRK